MPTTNHRQPRQYPTLPCPAICHGATRPLRDDHAHGLFTCPASGHRTTRPPLALLPILCTTLLTALSATLPATLPATAGAVEAVPPLAVQTVPIEATDHYTVNRRYAGQINHRRASTLGFTSGGTIGRILVDVGSHVKQGTILAELDQRRLLARRAQAEANVARTLANITVAESDRDLSDTTYQRLQELHDKGHTTAQRVDEARYRLQAARARAAVATAQHAVATANLRAIEVDVEEAQIKAPYDGIIQTRNADEGSVAQAGTTILEIVEADHLEARIGLPVTMADHLDVGARHDLRIDNRDHPATLRELLPRVDSTTNTVIAVLDLVADPDNRLFAGALAELTLDVSVQQSGFWVPLAALAESQRGLWSVLVVDQSGDAPTVRSRLVEIIHRGDDHVYVQGTLRAGDRIIESGVSRVVPGQVVRLNSH